MSIEEPNYNAHVERNHAQQQAADWLNEEEESR